MKSRHLAREIAVQTLYSLDFHDKIRSVSLPYADGFVGFDEKEQEALEQDVIFYSYFIINGVLEHIDEIDEFIGRFSIKRTIKDISIVDRNILRIGVFTLLFDKDVDDRVVIDEAVKLSLEFSTEVNYRFINGVLDSAARYLHDSVKNGRAD